MLTLSSSLSLNLSLRENEMSSLILAILRFIETKLLSKLFCGSRLDHLSQEIITRKQLFITVSFQTVAAVFLLQCKVNMGKFLVL